MNLSADIYGVEWIQPPGKAYSICRNWAVTIRNHPEGDGTIVFHKENIRTERGATGVMEREWKKLEARVTEDDLAL